MTENNLFSSLFPDLEILVDNYNIINLTFLTKKDLWQKNAKLIKSFYYVPPLNYCAMCVVPCCYHIFLIRYTSIHKQVK